MYHRKPFWSVMTVLVVLSCAGAENSSAQTGAPEDQPAQAYSQVETACAAETARFCPTPDQSRYTPQNEVMCLKFYRPDLNFSCRKAIDTALRLEANGS